MLLAAVILLIVLSTPPAGVAGQTVAVGVSAVAAWRHLDRTPDGGTLNEFQLVRPVVMARIALSGALAVTATANFEGLTMPSGEPWLGGWGEGFIDRRHPHTYVHELLVVARHRGRCGRSACAAGAFVGKGFVPFGSDDPMSRPLLRFPINHHLAQILERAVLGGQAGFGPVMIEGALFNGDEPERPGQWPRVSGRFGDSWAARLTVSPSGPLTLTASFAEVASPEHRGGAGGRQTKTHLGARLEPSFRWGRGLLFAEVARTSELDGFFVFTSALAEARWQRGPVALQYRVEVTDRPEEERLTPFRSARPQLENALLGITRWTTHTVGAVFDVPIRQRTGSAAVVVEATGGRIRDHQPGVFDLAATYGGDRFFEVSIGLRLALGSWHPVMGRYGIAERFGGHH